MESFSPLPTALDSSVPTRIGDYYFLSICTEMYIDTKLDQREEAEGGVREESAERAGLEFSESVELSCKILSTVRP